MNIHNPEVTVIIPFCNRIHWLREAVDSVLMQTYSDFEIILVDDGSVEDAREIVKASEKIRYYKQSYQGVSAARNIGIDLARGKFIAFLDSDDLFLPEKLEIQVEAFRSNPEVGLLHTSYYEIDETGETIRMIASGDLSGDMFPSILYNCPIATPTVMVNRYALANGLRFLEDVEIAEDILFWAAIAEKLPIIGIGQALTKVRMHDTNASTSSQKQLIGMENVLSHLGDYKSIDKKTNKFVTSMILIFLGDLLATKKKYRQAALAYFRAIVTSRINPQVIGRIFAFQKVQRLFRMILQ